MRRLARRVVPAKLVLEKGCESATIIVSALVGAERRACSLGDSSRRHYGDYGVNYGLSLKKLLEVSESSPLRFRNSPNT